MFYDICFHLSHYLNSTILLITIFPLISFTQIPNKGKILDVKHLKIWNKAFGKYSRKSHQKAEGYSLYWMHWINWIILIDLMTLNGCQERMNWNYNYNFILLLQYSDVAISNIADYPKVSNSLYHVLKVIAWIHWWAEVSICSVIIFVYVIENINSFTFK